MYFKKNNNQSWELNNKLMVLKSVLKFWGKEVLVGS